MTKIFALLTAITSLGIISCSDKNKCGCSSKYVCVAVVNTTGQPLKKVKLIVKGITKDTIGQVSTQENACLSFKSNGENSFMLQATLSNSKSVISKEQYSEGGYKFTATVTEEEIKIE